MLPRSEAGVGGGKRSYMKVSDEQRAQLLELLSQKMTISDAAEQTGVNYENAKAIFRVYRLEKRKTKRSKRLSRFASEHERHKRLLQILYPEEHAATLLQQLVQQEPFATEERQYPALTAASMSGF